ncbi:MAG: DUF177 domain-containing protein [Burkholderiaceae bacterium]|nr:DUF177 domain-containing protein [Burkholderiaceae bacterium]
MNAVVIDTFEFSRKKESLQGEQAVADFARLREETADTSGSVQWAVRGGAHALGYLQMDLSVKAEVKLMCQRCLTPFAFAIASEATLVLARDEEVADELEDKLADEELEVIAGSKNMNVLELVEDEVLLAIPLSPKHERCPDQFGQEPSSTDKRVSPFEVLKNKQ